VVKETATWLANALGQEAVFVKINNQPYLIRMTEQYLRFASPSHHPTRYVLTHRCVNRKGNDAAERKEKKAKKARGRRHNKNYRFFKVSPTMVYECNHQG
jgi:hypothetical protein